MRWAVRAAWVAAAFGLVLGVGGWAAWIGYVMLGYLAVALVLVRLVRTLHRAVAEERRALGSNPSAK